MIRYGIRMKRVHSTYDTNTEKFVKDSVEDEYQWIASGIGRSYKIEEAYIYTKKELADKKTKEFIKYPQWYADVEVVEFEVSLVTRD